LGEGWDEGKLLKRCPLAPKVVDKDKEKQNQSTQSKGAHWHPKL